ncbi:ATP-binding protein [Spirosoma fluminis]
MTSSTEDNKRQCRQLADYLVTHRETVLNRWPITGKPDKAIQKGSRLVGEKLVDPLPALLTFFTQGIAGELQESDLVARACHHQIHRWQHGYPLTDLLAELDNFYDSLDTEIQHFLERYPQTLPGVIAQAYTQLRQLAKTVNRGMALPVDQLRQTGADGQMKTLQAELDRLQQGNSQRVDRLRQVTHDLHSYLGIIATAASILREVIKDDDEVRYRDMISRNVSAANHLINQLLTDAQAE